MSVIVQYFSQIELKVMAKMNGEDKRCLMWERVVMFPSILKFANLRKSRARMMAKAMMELSGQAIKGNVKVTYVDVSSRFYFAYRNTLIATWKASEDIYEDVHAGEYEDTVSTRYQRKMIREAIEEFNREVIGICG